MSNSIKLVAQYDFNSAGDTAANKKMQITDILCEVNDLLDQLIQRRISYTLVVCEKALHTKLIIRIMYYDARIQ